MRSFYSILQVPIRPAGQEQLNIGLLFAGEEGSYFRFSNRKLDFVKKLIPAGSHNLLRSYLFGLAETINRGQDVLLGKLKNEEFISYLANYNSNLLTFSKPVPIELDVNEKNYQLLFEKFVFTFEEEKKAVPQKVMNLHQQLTLELYPRIKERVNVDQILTAKEIPTLLVPSVKVNFIGQNAVPVAGHGVDFTKSPDHISGSLSHFISLIKSFELSHKEGKYYVIGKEPDPREQKQHDSWEHIRNSGLIEFVDVSETDKITDYIHQHHVRPFVKE